MRVTLDGGSNSFLSEAGIPASHLLYGHDGQGESRDVEVGRYWLLSSEIKNKRAEKLVAAHFNSSSHSRTQSGSLKTSTQAQNIKVPSLCLLDTGYAAVPNYDVRLLTSAPQAPNIVYTMLLMCPYCMIPYKFKGSGVPISGIWHCCDIIT